MDDLICYIGFLCGGLELKMKRDAEKVGLGGAVREQREGAGLHSQWGIRLDNISFTGNIYYSLKHKMLDAIAVRCVWVYAGACILIMLTVSLLHRYLFPGASDCLNSTLTCWTKRLTQSAWGKSVWIFQSVCVFVCDTVCLVARASPLLTHSTISRPRICHVTCSQWQEISQCQILLPASQILFCVHWKAHLCVLKPNTPAAQNLVFIYSNVAAFTCFVFSLSVGTLSNGFSQRACHDDWHMFNLNSLLKYSSMRPPLRHGMCQWQVQHW